MEITMKNWTKQVTSIINQRNYRLPPTWSSRQRETIRQPETGREVHISGKGGELKDRIAKLLASARKKVVVSSFLLADRDVEAAILEAAGRGVRVYVMLASEARLGDEPGDGEFERRVLAEHNDVLSRLGGWALIRSAPHFHAKLVLVDPDERPAGLLLTANLTREALERNEELAVELTPKEVKEAAELVRWAIWEGAEHEMVELGNFRAVKPLGRVDHPAPSPHVLATTSSVTQLREEAVDLIDGASGELIVSSYGWDAGHPVVERLCARAREGVSLTVLARTRLRAMPALAALAEAGARVLGFKWLHAKALWSDSGRGLVMSANLEKHGLDGGFELGLRLEGERADELRIRLERWSSQAAWELLPAPALGEVAGDVRVWHGGNLIDLEVKPRLTVDLGSVTAASAHVLKAPAPDLPRINGLPQPAHELECRRLVRAPDLHPKAKEIMRTAGGGPEMPERTGARDSRAKAASRTAAGKKTKPAPYEPPVFKEPDGKLVVAVRSPEEIQVARRVAEEAGAASIVVRMTAREGVDR